MSPVRRTLFIIASVAVVAAIEAIALAPAALIDTRLAPMTGGALRLGDTEGTIWRGRGTLLAGTTRTPVAWRLLAWPLIQGELRLQLLADAGSPIRGDVDIVEGRLKLRDADVMLPASLLAAIAVKAPSGAGWIVGGDLRLSTAALDWAPPANRGDARLHWRGARLTYPGGAAPLSLGDVAIAITGEDDRLSGIVTNEGGDLAIRGNATVRANESMRLSLVLTPSRDDDPALKQVLSALGTRDGSGWRVDWRVPLR